MHDRAWAWACIEVQLCDGFNAFSARAQCRQYLFLLNVALNPFGRAVSVLSLHPRALSGAPCSLEFEVRLRTQIYDKDTSKFIASVVMIQGK